MKKIIELLLEIVAILRAIHVHGKRWLSPEELELEFGLKMNTVSKYRMEQTIPFSKPSSKIIKYDRIKIDEWLENNEVVGIDHACR